MLITFTCEAYENITMFGDVGKKLLKMMGYAGQLQGVIDVDEIPAIETRLRKALEEHARAIEHSQNHDDTAPSVSLEHRAFPLLEMFKVAEKKKSIISWKVS